MSQPDPTRLTLIEIAWYYRPGDPSSRDSEIGTLLRRDGQDYIIRSLRDGRTYRGHILVRTYKLVEKKKGKES